MPRNSESCCKPLPTALSNPPYPLLTMSRQSLFIGSLILTLFVGLLLGRFIAPSSGESHEGHAHEKTAANEPTVSSIWTCSMHPQIQQSESGQCPICGMDLIPLAVDVGSADSGPRTLQMSESARVLAEIETSTVESRFPETSLRMVGKLDYDETRVRSISARFPARIDQLFVNYTGVTVNPGEHLARIYSPELLTAQKELLTSHAINPDGPIAKISREKLRLWDLQSEQIDEILRQGKATDDFELRTPIGGVVIMKKVKEGDYVETGEPLFRIADLGILWLHLQAFESDLAKLRYGQFVEFTVDAWSGETFTGRIAFIAPNVDVRTRTVQVRVNVPNPDFRLKPGMFARGLVRVKLAKDNRIFAPELAGKWIGPMHPEIIKDAPGQCEVCGMDLVPASTLGYTTESPEEAPLIVPSSAVLRTGTRAVVYVKIDGADLPAFQGREVVLGAAIDDGYIIASGLKAGEEIVTNGAFKIDSSLQILAKPSMMNPAGGSPTPGHQHGGAPTMEATSSKDHSGHQMTASLEIALSTSQEVLPAYYELQNALSKDDLEAAKTAVKLIMESTGHSGDLPDLLHKMLMAEDLASLREPTFRQLSEALIAVIKSQPEVFPRNVVRLTCPMANNNQGADWLQTTEEVHNPYFGSMMFSCGEVVEKLK